MTYTILMIPKLCLSIMRCKPGLISDKHMDTHVALIQLNMITVSVTLQCQQYGDLNLILSAFITCGLDNHYHVSCRRQSKSTIIILR